MRYKICLVYRHPSITQISFLPFSPNRLRNTGEVTRPHCACLIVSPYIDMALETQEHIVCFTVVVEADGISARTTGADKSDCAVADFACDKQTHCEPGQRNVVYFAA